MDLEPHSLGNVHKLRSKQTHPTMVSLCQPQRPPNHTCSSFTLRWENIYLPCIWREK